MMWGELRGMLNGGQTVTVRFTDMVEKLDCDDSPDKNMIGLIHSGILKMVFVMCT